MSDKTSRQDFLTFDEAAFMRRVPQAMERLNVRGAYIARVPPGDHRLDAIPPGELARHGLMLRRPDESMPALRKGWDEVFGRIVAGAGPSCAAAAAGAAAGGAPRADDHQPELHRQ